MDPGSNAGATRAGTLDADTPQTKAYNKLREEAFVANIVFGMPVYKAMRSAGYEISSASLAAELLLRPSVIAGIVALRTYVNGKLVESVQSIAMQLDFDREFAYDTDNAGAAISASMGKAKLLGMLESSSSGRIPAKITIEWSAPGTEQIYERGPVIEEINLEDD